MDQTLPLSSPLPKTLNTLVEDIYELFNPDKEHEPSEDNLNWFAENLKNMLRVRLAERQPAVNPLRFSALGKQDRQIYFDTHPDGNEEKMLAKTYFKFLYGDILEHIVLFLAKEAGHVVTLEQAEIEVDGVKGHIDAIIDGVVVDVKSASSFGYKKFKEQTVVENDPFGYTAQLAGYASVLTPGQSAAWIAFDKVSGDMCVSLLSSSIITDYDPIPRIAHLKQVVEQNTPPPLCYDPVPDGKSGNFKLPTPCSYCQHKRRCHPTLRTFFYSSGPRFLTTVAKQPDVPELKVNDVAALELPD